MEETNRFLVYFETIINLINIGPMTESCCELIILQTNFIVLEKENDISRTCKEKRSVFHGY